VPSLPIAAYTDRVSLMERKRQLVRDELTEAAVKLLAFQGFDQTTIEQMAAAAGVSRRTFFRYFQSKEDVVIATLSEMSARIVAGLESRPPEEPPAAALQATLRSVFAAKVAEHPEKTHRLACITVQTPSILARYLERQVTWKAELAAVLARRMATDPTDLRPAVLVAVAFAAFDAALVRWADSPTDDLHAIVDTCFGIAFP
jgi:AcrR family transcriptional regulator